ncbi:DUF6461 domain-containing protein [Streptomyces sp. NPDC095613]|uniref:DUF6461 domain-containing protein n=1 Tax=Streptomyces sp. NPDC095613 TaxID=3155540 RepID=UPI00331EFB7D
MTESSLAMCVPSDHFGLTCVRDVSPDEVLARLSVTDQAPYPLYTPGVAVRRLGFGHENPAARICQAGQWTFLLDVDAHGLLLQTPVLTRLSVGTEAVSVWHVMDGTTRIAHAIDRQLMAHYDDDAVHLTTGADPSRVNHALAEAGFFPDDDEFDDDWSPAAMALVAVEREFGLTLSSGTAESPLPTVSLNDLRG